MDGNRANNSAPLAKIQKAMYLIQMHGNRPTSPRRRELIRGALRDIRDAADRLIVDDDRGRELDNGPSDEFDGPNRG